MKFFLIVVSFSLFSNALYADELFSTRRQGLIEKSHHVDVYLDEGVARLRVRRSFYNPGTLHEQVEMTIQLPRGAAAIGLRIKAGKKWHKGELMEATKAETLYMELTGVGRYAPKDPALLSWSSVNQLALSIFPVAPNTTSFVEYTLIMPMAYHQGRYLISYPRQTYQDPVQPPFRPANTLSIPTISYHGSGKMEVDGVEVGLKTPLTIPDRDPLLDKLGFSKDRNYVVIPLEVKRIHQVNPILKVSIDHTWSGDVGIYLVTPEGEAIPIDEGDWAGEDGNQKSIREGIRYSKKSRKDSRKWSLVVWDNYPNEDAGQITKWSLTFTDNRGKEEFVNSKPVSIPDTLNASLAELSFKATFKGLFDFRYSKVDIFRKKKFLSYHLGLAKKLSEMPKDLLLSIVIDASHSMDGHKLANVRLCVKEILRLIPDAKVDLITFSRQAKRVKNRRWKAKTLLEKLNSLTITRHNGSHLDRALFLSEEYAMNHKGSHQTIVFTDNRLRPTWDSKVVASQIHRKKNAPIHLIGVSEKGIRFERADGLSLYPIAKKRGGVTMEFANLERYRSSKLKKKALYLIRPTLLENVKVGGQDAHDIREGQGVHEILREEDAPNTFSFSGYLWSRKIDKRVKAKRSTSKALAAFVFSLDMFEELNEKEQLKLAMFGNVVSPVTSFLAIEPGVRPSFVGLSDFGGIEGIGFGGGGVGAGNVGSGLPKISSIQSYMDGAIKHCSALIKRQLSFSVNTTDHEIVDIKGPSKAPGSQCVIEEMWKVNLPVTRPWDQNNTYLVVANP